jgi:aryl-alcohol dehydrogenase-like predicted oxidoreductase
MSALATGPLGQTGLQVTKLGFGAMELRGTPHRNPRPLEPGQADKVLNTVLDAGITFIDTSIDYGESEEHIGRAIAHRREEYVLASKCGCPVNALDLVDAPAGPLVHDYSPGNIRAGVEQSLRRLRTDRIDLVQLHISPSLDVLRDDDVLATLETLRDEGKLAAFGISSTLPDIWDHVELGAFDSFQVPYSALEPEHDEAITAVARSGAGVVVRGGVAKGSPARIRAGKADLWAVWDSAGLDDLLDAGERRVDLLLRYVLAEPRISTVIIGSASPEHVLENVATAQRPALSPDVRDEIDRRVAKTAGQKVR